MIEKLNPKMEFVEISVLGNKKAECLDFEAGRKLNLKINELVDAVNGILDYAPLEMAMKAEPESAENVQDKFAEQRKWIGKLCKFWDIDNNNLYYGPLTKIHDTSPYCYECNHKMCYAFCEPVKDDVIYKGGDNE